METMKILCAIRSHSTDKPVLIKHHVFSEPTDFTRAYAISGEYLRLHCPPELLIHIVDIMFGRNSTASFPNQYDGSVNCYLADAMAIVRDICGGLTECVEKPLYSDPCVGVSKYTQLIYRCVGK